MKCMNLQFCDVSLERLEIGITECPRLNVLAITSHHGCLQQRLGFIEVTELRGVAGKIIRYDLFLGKHG